MGGGGGPGGRPQEPKKVMESDGKSREAYIGVTGGFLGYREVLRCGVCSKSAGADNGHNQVKTKRSEI